jgi:DMSO/TMAO reductase YedYZ molybdopterin-dependent catalytic subunit
MADSAPGWTTGMRDGRHANVAVRVDDVRMTATRDRPPLHAAIAGAVATLAALGTSELAAGLLSAQSLVAAVGGAVIDLQPAGAKDFVVALFGQNDKLALELFIVGVSVLVGAALGLAARRSFMVGAGGFALFAGLGFFATLSEPSSVAAPAAIVAGVAAITGIQVLSWLLGPPSSPAPATPDEPPDRGSMPDWSRRGFLLRSGSAAAVAAVAGLGGRSLLEASRSLPASADAAIPPAGEVVTMPAGSSLPIDGLTPVVVPNNDFYRIDTALLTPNVDLPSWSLGIHGLVDRDTRLSYAELVELPLIEQYVTIACVSNEVGGNLVGNAKWTGVRLRDVLEIAGVQASATQLVGRSVDGWTAGMPTSWVMDPAREPMIAVKMNDEVLPRTHGFPARLIVPGLFGYVSATKWLSELELTTWESFDGYWVPLGWAKEGPILTQSRIDVPRNGGSVPADRVVIAGVAWAPDRGISKVEVAIDGQWRDCTLATPISDATWVQWNHAWDALAAGPGDHRIEVRATDGNGEIQSANVTPPAPDGARGYHSISVRIG